MLFVFFRSMFRKTVFKESCVLKKNSEIIFFVYATILVTSFILLLFCLCNEKLKL